MTKWKQIIAVMLALAVIAGAFMIAMYVKSRKDPGPETTEIPTGDNVIIVTAGHSPAPTKVPENLYINTNVTVEAGSVDAITPELFIKDTAVQAEFVTDLESIDPKTTGVYDVNVRINAGGTELDCVSRLTLADTTPPAATPADVETELGGSANAEQFVTGITDVSAVTVAFKTQPDFSKAGQFPVTVILTDAAGNSSELTATLTVKPDEIPPVIHGVIDREIYLGDTISYKSGVTVTDDLDPNPTLTVDNSGVNLKSTGRYTVKYIATDASGNSTTVTAMIIVKDRPVGEENLEQMNSVIDGILSLIITDDMTDIQKLYKIFKYSSETLYYVSHSDKTSYISETIRGIREGNGDCFTFYAVTKALMERAGFQTIDVTREGGSTQHFWSLVYVNGSWYHIDTCPRAPSRNKYWYCFLRTDEELKWFSENYKGFYNFNTSIVPASGTERIAEVNWKDGQGFVLTVF